MKTIHKIDPTWSNKNIKYNVFENFKNSKITQKVQNRI